MQRARQQLFPSAGFTCDQDGRVGVRQHARGALEGRAQRGTRADDLAEGMRFRLEPRMAGARERGVAAGQRRGRELAQRVAVFGKCEVVRGAGSDGVGGQAVACGRADRGDGHI